MSSLPLAFAPLPYDADPGAAFTDTIVLPAAPRQTASGAYFAITVPGEFFFYPLSLACAFSTSGVAGNRALNYVLIDQNNVEIIRSGLSSSFAPGGAFGCGWQISLGTAYTDGSAEFFGPLPPRLLEPTQQVGVVVVSFQAGDAVVGQVTVIKIPRRRPINPVEALAATPAIV